MKRDLYILLNDKEFYWLVLGFGVGLGIFNSMTTLIENWTGARGYTSDDAGMFGGVLIGGGASLSLSFSLKLPFSPLLETHKNERYPRCGSRRSPYGNNPCL